MILRAVLAPFVLLTLLAAGYPLWGQQADRELRLSSSVDLQLVGNAAQTNLELARRFLADEQWEGAVEKIRGVMENESEALIAWQPQNDDDQYPRYVSMRTWCHYLLAQWAKQAPQALEHYRQQVDPLAGRWYQEAVDAAQGTAHGAALLTRIVDQMFLSRYGDDASYRLGEIALERGDFRQARECWERLSPVTRCTPGAAELLRVAPGTPWWLALRHADWHTQWEALEPHFQPENVSVEAFLAYPDTNLDLARVRARLVIVSILEGSLERAELEWELFRRLHPDATGALLGQEGTLVELLSKLLEDSQGWPRDLPHPDWPTFAGSPQRNRIASSEVDPAARPLWSRSLPGLDVSDERLGHGRLRVAESAESPLSYHPVVVGEQVILTTATRIRIFDLQTGRGYFDRRPAEASGSEEAEERTASDARQRDGEVFRMAAVGLERLPATQPYFGVPRFTATVHKNYLFAKIGSPWTGAREPDQLPTDHRGMLVGLDLTKQGKMLSGFPIRPENENWSFEGAPVSDGRRLYVAMRYRDKVGVAAHVACYDIETGEQQWRRFVCAADTLAEDTATEITHNLITLDQDRLYYNSNLGAVAAIASQTGAVRWVVRYPRATHATHDPYRSDRHFFRDLTPALIHKGLVISAPADCDFVFALSAITGSVVWASLPEQAADVVHLLGVGNDTLIAGGDYLYWFDVHSGALKAQFPDGQAPPPARSINQPRGFGRGILAGARVYWPTREHLYVFHQQPGSTSTGSQPRLARAPIDLGMIEVDGKPLQGGNLTLSQGVLLIAEGDRIVALNSYGVPVPAGAPAADDSEVAPPPSPSPDEP